MNSSFPASLAKKTFLGLLATGTLGYGVIQPASAANVVCSAIDASSIASGIPPSFLGSCGAINPGDTFEISYTGTLNVADSYSLEVANINDSFTNSQAFKNVQLLVTGAIGASSFTNQAITIWPSNDFAIGGTSSRSPYLSQGQTSYSTNLSTDTFGGLPVSTAANFILTSPQPNTGLGTAGLIITEPLQLSTAGITSFTGFKITGQFFSGGGPFALGLGIYPGAFTPGAAPNQILGNAFNIPVPAPMPLLGIGAALGWSRRLRRRIGAAKA
jgi:hypothetical protein